jgi:hypothetical protein
MNNGPADATTGARLSGEPQGRQCRWARSASMMTLYSRGRRCAQSSRALRAREKALEVRVVETDPSRPPEDLIDLNPYQTVPTLVDRELGGLRPGHHL